MVFGSGFSIFDACLAARLSRSAADSTSWISQSALLCKYPVSQISRSVGVVVSTPSHVPPVQVGHHSISGFVRSVVTGAPVPGAHVALVLDSLVRAAVNTNADGYFAFTALLNEDYVVVTHAANFAPLWATVPASLPPKNYTAALGPALQPRQHRIVLTWATFADLDAQLKLPDGCDVCVVVAFSLQFCKNLVHFMMSHMSTQASRKHEVFQLMASPEYC
jgi:hypothetical protein